MLRVLSLLPRLLLARFPSAIPHAFVICIAQTGAHIYARMRLLPRRPDLAVQQEREREREREREKEEDKSGPLNLRLAFCLRFLSAAFSALVFWLPPSNHVQILMAWSLSFSPSLSPALSSPERCTSSFSTRSRRARNLFFSRNLSLWQFVWIPDAGIRAIHCHVHAI